MSGFWTWATAHPFLTFIIVMSITNTIQVVVKAMRPTRESPNESGGGPAQSEEATVIASLNDRNARPGYATRESLAAERRRLPAIPEPRERPVRRRTMWDRLKKDDD